MRGGQREDCTHADPQRSSAVVVPGFRTYECVQTGTLHGLALCLSSRRTEFVEVGSVRKSAETKKKVFPRLPCSVAVHFRGHRHGGTLLTLHLPDAES